MTSVVADDVLRSKLFDFSRDLVICDERGRVVAQLRCVAQHELDGWVQVSEPESPEEWARLRDSDEPGMTTEELKKYLRSL
jgi:hypothetical protein